MNSCCSTGRVCARNGSATFPIRPSCQLLPPQSFPPCCQLGLQIRQKAYGLLKRFPASNCVRPLLPELVHPGARGRGGGTPGGPGGLPPQAGQQVGRRGDGEDAASQCRMGRRLPRGAWLAADPLACCSEVDLMAGRIACAQRPTCPVHPAVARRAAADVGAPPSAGGQPIRRPPAASRAQPVRSGAATGALSRFAASAGRLAAEVRALLRGAGLAGWQQPRAASRALPC